MTDEVGGTVDCLGCGREIDPALVHDCPGPRLLDQTDEGGESAALDAGDRALADMERERREEEKNQRVALDGKFGAFGFIVMPSEAQAPILNVPLRRVLHCWLYEMNARKELKAVGVTPRTRVILSGPPGCGKTTLAHHVAARLGFPMLVIQSHCLISKWLGQTGENIGKLFRAARKDAGGLVLFFDEFDALAKSREQLGGQGADTERANMTNALLQEFDRHQGLIFAATNVVKGIDQAIWRRFQMQVEIGFPGEDERDAIVRLYLKPFEPHSDTVKALAAAMTGASPALIKESCEFLKRSLVLNPKMKMSTALADLVRQLVTAIRPPEEVEGAALWSNTSPTIAELRDMPWPPKRGG